MIAPLIIGFLLLIANGFLVFAAQNIEEGEDNLKILLLVILFISILATGFLGVALQEDGKRDAYKDALDGNNPYEKIYHYKQADTSYVKIDSVYRRL